MSYAIIKTGGNQTKVAVDDIVVTNRVLDDKGQIVKDGSKVEFPCLMFVDDSKTLIGKDAAKVKVTAEVVRQERGKKIVGMKYKNKTGYKKRFGHRQELTRLKITSIK
ncbi:MAG: 50S ribosomal protein L21 [Candidatus Ancillula sp.]|nr:50S ribosomal protein L21 [Candidatus Ancillula sp.]